MMHKLILSLFWASLVACTTQTTDEAHHTDCPKKHPTLSYTTQKIDISVKDLQYTHEASFVYSNNTLDYYYAYDPAKSKIDIFDIRHKKYVDSIKIYKEGPNQLLNFSDFYVHNPDSIFVNTNHFYKIYLINNQSKVIQQWKIDQKLPDGTSPNGGYYFSTLHYAGMRFYYQAYNQSILIRSLYMIDPPFSVAYYQRPILAEYNLKTQRFNQLLGDFPANYLLPKLSPNDDSFPFIKNNQNEVFISYDVSHTIHRYSSNKQKSVVCVRSLYLNEEFKMLVRNAPTKERQKLFSLQGCYVGLHYDPYRQLIYRVAKHNQPEKDKNGLLNKYQNAPFSIMVLDNEGNVLGETEPFAGSIYDYSKLHITKDGILLSKENKFNPNNQEELLEFDLIKIELPK
jgi:Domain of unknown function (DUF4221)